MHPHQMVYRNLYGEWYGATSEGRDISRKQARMIVNRQMPPAYTRGEVFWNGTMLNVEPPILIPREDTATWIDELRKKLLEFRPKCILDVGFGSGCISLRLAEMFKDCHITGIDNSPQALRLAKLNQADLKISNVDFILADANVFDYSGFDAIISNPPYIRHVDRVTKVSPTSRRWESATALHAGMNGTEYHRLLIDKFVAHPTIRLLAMELDGTKRQYKEVANYATGLSVSPIKDYSQRPRAIVIERHL